MLLSHPVQVRTIPFPNLSKKLASDEKIGKDRPDVAADFATLQNRVHHQARICVAEDLIHSDRRTAETALVQAMVLLEMRCK